MVRSNWQSPQADEAVGVLSQHQWVSIQAHLLHVGSDVVRVVAFAEGLIRYSGYVVVLPGESIRRLVS